MRLSTITVGKNPTSQQEESQLTRKQWKKQVRRTIARELKVDTRRLLWEGSSLMKAGDKGKELLARVDVANRKVIRLEEDSGLN
jgi:hypothetical protein